MANQDNMLSDKLTGYLASLPPASLVLLAHELARTALSEDLDPANALIHAAACHALEAKGTWGKIVAYPERMAFADIEPFRTEINTDAKHRGRISAETLHAVWVAVMRNPANTDVGIAVRKAAQSVASAPDTLLSIVSANRAAMESVLLELHDNMSRDGAQHQRISATIGGLRGAQDLSDIIAVMSIGNKLDAFQAFLGKGGDRFGQLDDKSFAPLNEALQLFSQEELVYPLVILLGQMPNPGSLINLLTIAEQSDDFQHLVRARYAPVVEVLLNELDVLACTVRKGISDWHVTDIVVPAVRRFHEISSSLSAAIDMEIRSDWSNRLSGKRARISGSLRETLEMTLAKLRLGIQPNGAGIVCPDMLDIEQAVDSASLLMAIKPLRSELALNECVSRVHTAVETFFDTAARNLPQLARHADPTDMTALNARFDGLYRTSSVLFGEEYAALLRRSGEVAGLRLPDQDPQASAA